MITKPTRAYLAPTLGPASEGGLGMVWDTQKNPAEQPVVVIPVSESSLTPAVAVVILAREQHECIGEFCGHCQAVMVLTKALFPLESAA